MSERTEKTTLAYISTVAKSGNLAEAESLLQQLLLEAPTDARALCNLGAVLMRLHDHDAAKAITEADIDKFPYRRSRQAELISRIETYLLEKAATASKPPLHAPAQTVG